MFLKSHKPTLLLVVFMLLCSGVAFASFIGRMERYYGISLDGTTMTIPSGTILTSPVITGGTATITTSTITALVATTADINGGTADSVTIGSTTPASSNFTNCTVATSFQCDVTSGTVITGIYQGFGTIDNGSTTTVVTLKGLTDSSTAIAVPISGNPNGVTWKTVVCSTNSVTIFSADPGAETVVSIIGFRD